MLILYVPSNLLLSPFHRILLQNDADVNAAEINNDTPLSWASQKGNLETIKILLEYNAVVDTVNYNGFTPLFRATTIHSAGLNSDADDACLELLIKASGQFDLREEETGELPARVAGDNRLVELLNPYCVTARPLQHLCRFAVRWHLGTPRFLPNVVPKLPLPPFLQDCVLLQR